MRPTSGSLIRRSPALVVALILAVVTAACRDSTGPTLPPTEPPVTVDSVTVSSGEVPGTRVLDVKLSEPDGVRVRYYADEPEPLVVDVETPAQVQHVPLARIRPARRYQVEVLPLSRVDSSGTPFSTSFVSDTLPSDLAKLHFTTEGTLGSPMVLAEIVHDVDGFEGAVALDGEGQVVWYFRGGAVGGTARLDNGNLIILAGKEALYEVNPTEGVVHQTPQRQPPFGFHHDAIVTPSNTVYFISHDSMTVDSTLVMGGEAIWEWDPETGNTTKRWSAFQDLSYTDDFGWGSRPDDWLHANGLAIGPSGNVMISLRYLNQVLSLTPDFSTVQWRLGGVNATIPTPGDAAFYGQHQPKELDVNGERHMLLFDNGDAARGYSRALELRFDPDTKTAEKVWEFIPPDHNWAPIVGDARRWDNGDTFVHFGSGPNVGASKGPVETYEVDPQGNVVWHLVISGYDQPDSLFVVYRVTPLGSLVGEHVESAGTGS